MELMMLLCRLTKRDDGMMEFDQILLLPPVLAAVYALPRRRPTRFPSLRSCPLSLPYGSCCSVGVFRSVTYSLSKLDDLLALLFGETLHSSLARKRGREDGKISLLGDRLFVFDRRLFGV
jgi:hypothetical protein